MAIDFGVDNTTRQYTVPNSADLHLPDSDWTIAALIRPQDATKRKTIMSMGQSAANTFLCFVHDEASNDSGFAVRYGTLAEINWGGGDVVQDKYYWQYTARRGNNIYVGAAEFGGAIASEGTPVDYGGQSIQPTADLFIGSQVDNNVARYMQGQIDRVLFIDGYGMTLTDAQTLAGGTLPEDAAFAASIDINFFFTDSSAASITDSVSSLVATKVNTGWGANEATPYGAPPSAVKGIQVTMPVVSKTGLHAAFFDQPLPSAFAAPTFKTATATIDSNGIFELDLDAVTALNVGDAGHVILYELNGTDHKLSPVFSGQVNVVDIA